MVPAAVGGGTENMIRNRRSGSCGCRIRVSRRDPEMKLTGKRFTGIITSLMITALLLTGAVPCFTWDGQAVGAWGAPLQPETVYAAETSDEETAAGTETPVLPAVTIDWSDAPKIHGTQAIIMDLDTGTVLYEKDADKIIEPASLTKILNCMVVLDTLDLDQELTVPDDVETEGSCIWLEPGEKATVRELIYGMMLESGNDAAQVLGLGAGKGSLEQFSLMMNAKALECGAIHTDYQNPNGLNEDREHLNYTTARDLALTTREAMQDPFFRKVVKTVNHTMPATNKSDKRKFRNSNACLWLKNQTTEIDGKDVPFKYKGCNGVKTGFTSDAGYCLVGSAARKGSDFLVVTLGSEYSEYRYQDAIKLWNYAFKKYETFKTLKAGEPAGVQRVWAGKKRNVEVGTQRDLGVTIYKGTGDEQNFETQFRLDNEKAEAPIKKGQKMGQALVFNGNKLVGREDLYALASVGEGGPLSHIGIADEDLPKAGAIAGGVLLLFILLIIVLAIHKRRQMHRKKAAIRGELKTMRTSGTGMTPRELTDLTGREEIMPIPRGPARISDEELKAWSSTKKRQGRDARTGTRGESRTSARSGARSGARRDAGTGMGSSAGRDPRRGSYSGSRFGGGTGQDGYGPDTSYGTSYDPSTPNAHMAPKMKITPRTPFTAEELNAMLDSTEVYDANQPRNHGKLTEEERRELMKRTRRPRSKR